MITLKYYLNIMASSLRHLFDWFDRHSGSMVAIATLLLVAVTASYMCEVRKHRRLVQKVVSIDTSPMVYAKLGKIIGERDDKNNKFKVGTYIAIKNCGKVRAKNVQIDYVLQHDNTSIKGAKGPLQYLFPGEDSSLATALVSIQFSPEEYSRLCEAMKQGEPYTIKKFKDKFERLRLHIDLSCEDEDGKKFPLSYSSRYSIDQKAWIWSEEDAK